MKKLVTSKIRLIIKSVNHSRIITKIEAFDRNVNSVFSYCNPQGIGDNETALRILKLLQRRNSNFVNIDEKAYPFKIEYWYWRKYYTKQ